MIVLAPVPDPPRPAPEIPDPEPTQPPVPPDLPQPAEPPGVPPPAPDPVPGPQPGEVPPQVPPELPAVDRFSRPGVPRLSFVVALVVACIAGSASAIAQATDKTPDQSPASPCQAQPNEQTGKDKDKAADRENGENKTLSGKLDRCNGVLVPPKTGDKQIEEPAPDVGTTPVIPPEAVPKQQTPK